MAVSASLVGIPIHVTDSLVPMLQVQQAPSAVSVFKTSLGTTGYMRPLWWAQVKFAFDAAGSRYFATFKGLHVALVAALIALFAWAAAPVSRTDFMTFSFALVVLTGIHTFTGLVWEAYPINHYLEITVLTMAALCLSLSRGGWWADVAASLVFAVAALTLETGLLVWVVLVTARLVGLRGVSTRGVLGVTALLCAYFYLRLDTYGVGLPALDERASGFGGGRLQADELLSRFGDRPYLFYLYNVVSSLLSVLWSEPRAGTWTVLVEYRRQELAPATMINLVTSLMMTGLLVWFAASRMRAWLRWRLEQPDRIVIVAIAVIVANSVISYGYTKDVIMGPAGAFYALAAFVVVRHAVVQAAASRRRYARVARALLLFVAASGWAWRSVGLHYHMKRMAFKISNEWTSVDAWLDVQEATPTTAEGRRLVTLLRDEALDREVVNLYFMPRWADRWFR
jgi:hypothetical protein